jgi:hypothetical protein
MAEEHARSDSPPAQSNRAADSRGLSFGNFALASCDGKHWHSYKRDRGNRWVQLRVFELSEGNQSELFSCLVRNAGFIPLEKALAIWCKSDFARDYKRLMTLLKPELTRLRRAMLASFGLASSAGNPLPKVRHPKGWQAIPEIGYAVREDGGWIVKRLDELSAEDRMDFAR